MSEKRLLLDLLRKELSLVSRALSNLSYSFEKVKHIKLDSIPNEEQFELFDSFSSRFLRMYEVLFNQLIRTILSIIGERQETAPDKMLNADRLNLVSGFEEFDEIRKLRNQVAHAIWMKSGLKFTRD